MAEFCVQCADNDGKSDFAGIDHTLTTVLCEGCGFAIVEPATGRCIQHVCLKCGRLVYHDKHPDYSSCTGLRKGDEEEDWDTDGMFS